MGTKRSRKAAIKRRAKLWNEPYNVARRAVEHEFPDDTPADAPVWPWVWVEGSPGPEWSHVPGYADITGYFDHPPPGNRPWSAVRGYLD